MFTGNVGFVNQDLCHHYQAAILFPPQTDLFIIILENLFLLI